MIATSKQRILPKPPLPATKEYRYIEPVSAGAFNHCEWDPEKGKRARVKSVEARQKKARQSSRESRIRTNPKRVWTPEEIADISRMREQGMIWKDIGAKYGTSDTSVRKVYERWHKACRD